VAIDISTTFLAKRRKVANVPFPPFDSRLRRQRLVGGRAGVVSVDDDGAAAAAHASTVAETISVALIREYVCDRLDGCRLGRNVYSLHCNIAN
jgi:hypothetical protein